MITVMGAEGLCDLFPDDLIPDVLELILDTWVSVRALLSPHPPDSDWREVPLTAWFCDKLRCAKRVRKLPVQIRLETHLLKNVPRPLAENELATVVERGRIDLCFAPTNTAEEENFLGFECKRLNVRGHSGFKSLAGEYVTEGMQRFFDSHEYAQGQFHGGMISYVMDGQIPAALRAVQDQVIAHQAALRFRTPPPPDLRPSEVLLGREEAWQTSHDRGSQPFTLHHLFLALVNPIVLREPAFL